jgi:predicted PurR-regulated permease PerM
MSDLPDSSDRRPTHIEAADTPGLHALLFVTVVVVVVSGLYVGRQVLIPITLAMLLSFLLAPLVGLLRRLYFGRVMSVLVAVLMALMVILSLGGLLGTQLATLAQEVPRYAGTIQHKVDTVQELMLSRISALTASLGRKIDPDHKSAAPAAAKPAPDVQKPVQVEVHEPEPTAMELARRIVTPVVEPLSTTAIVLIVSIFILLQREDLRDRMIRLFGSSDLHRTTLAMNDAARRLSRYLVTQFAVNTSFGVIVAIGLAFLGIPSPVMWGVLAALLRFMPYVGAPLAAVVPLTLAAAIDPGWSLLLWTAALYAGLELIIGQVVEPLLYGHSTGLSPFAVVVAAIFWTWLWGPIGLILSTPLTLCLVVLGRHVPRLEFLEVLLGDRPALTPVESFYQRMLAGDPDEAHDQAELLLDKQPLSSYYDQVAIPGLRLAAADAQKGALAPAHLERIKQSIQSLIEDLDDHEDEKPASGGSASLADDRDPEEIAGVAQTRAKDNAPLILCIAGRGPLDQQASAMLVQLLDKEGVAARVVPHSSTMRGTIGFLDVSNVAIVCITYLELQGNPSHLKYLMRRLRASLPRGVPVMVGLWPEGDQVLHDERLRTAVGADYYTSSLREAVRTCVKALPEPGDDVSPPALLAVSA